MTATHPCPRLRWLGVAWLAVWVPSYAHAYGWVNFLLLCDVGVFLVCLGLWRGSALLLSSQALAFLLVGALWAVDVLVRLGTGRHLLADTEYMFDPRFPVPIRLLSLYHVLVPAVLLLVVRRTGYDPRGFLVQCGLAVALTVAGRRFGPETNLNFAFRDPIFDRAWGPPAVHLAVILGVQIVVVYGLTHWLLGRLCPRRAAT